MKRLIAKAALVLFGAAAIIGIAGAPAAAASPRPCITGTVCIYEHLFIGHNRYVIVDNYSPGFCFNLPAEWDNRADSVRNLTNHEVSFFGGNYCQADGILSPSIIRPGVATILWDTAEANSMLFRRVV